MTETKMLDLLERAYEVGCFREVLKMIRAKTDPVLIEKVIQKCQKRHDEFNLDWSDLFGAD